MQADYTGELQRIANALSRMTPWWQHPWILATLSTMLGVIGGFAGQILLLRFTESRKRRTMRKMVYADITHLFVMIDSVFKYFSAQSPNGSSLEHSEDERRAYFKLIAPKISEDYIKANPEAYFTIPERLVSEGIYAMYRHLLSEPANFDAYLLSLNQIIALHFKSSKLTLDGVRQYVGKEEAKTLAPLLMSYEPKTPKV